MTIMLRITNADSARTVKLTHRDTNHDEKTKAEKPTIDQGAGNLGPGETREVWIHDSRALIVEEI